MYKTLVSITAALVILSAGLLVPGCAEAAGANMASWSAKYSKASTAGLQDWKGRYVTRRGFWLTDYSSSSAPRR
jgi:hypothetical protein